jgi:hypothetical protein
LALDVRWAATCVAKPFRRSSIGGATVPWLRLSRKSRRSGPSRRKSVIGAYNEFVESRVKPCQARYAPIVLINMVPFLVSMFYTWINMNGAIGTQTHTDECR